MDNHQVFTTISRVIEDTSMSLEVEKRFSPLLGSRDLIASIKDLSRESPVFQSSLSRLDHSLEVYSAHDFTREYESFYNSVMIISDELSLGIKKEVDQLKEIPLQVKGEDRGLFISSRIFVGNSILLGITSNDAIFVRTLEAFQKKTDKSIPRSHDVSA